jgi:Uma2 family endonuclease
MPGRDEMKPAASGVKLTYDDFVLFPDDGKRHVLVDGEHYVTPSPGTRHQQISGRLFLTIGNWLEANPIGQSFMHRTTSSFLHSTSSSPICCTSRTSVRQRS